MLYDSCNFCIKNPVYQIVFILEMVVEAFTVHFALGANIRNRDLLKDYVYINTPYLIVDDSVLSALCLAAKRGVDVRIATPHIWDKRLVHMTTRSYYRDLIAAGVKIYEYSKGFIHAKSFVSDDCIATVGTTNLDFRSLYLHFECGAWMWNSTAVMEVKQDFMDTLAVCQPITERDCKPNILIRIFQDALRLFAPLM